MSGWVPVEDGNKQYCWHSSAVDYGAGTVLLLRPAANNDYDTLEIAAVPLTDLQEQTLELIGTNINGNPYGSHFFNNFVCSIGSEISKLWYSVAINLSI